MDPVEQYGEMGKLNALARTDGIPVYSWEPTWDHQLERMLDKFAAERVALYYVLRPYFSTMQGRQPEDPNAFIEPFRKKRTRMPGLEGTLPSVDAIDAIWKRDFADYDDWRELSDAYGYPGYLNELFAHSNLIRDEHLANVIVDLMSRGERVFAAAGSSHAVKLRKTLESFDKLE